MADEVAAAPTAEAPTAVEAPAPEPTTPPKGPDGKFLSRKERIRQSAAKLDEKPADKPNAAPANEAAKPEQAEAKPTEEQQEGEKEPLDKSWAALKRERRKNKAHREQNEAKEREISAREARLSELERLRESDPYAFADRLGLKFDHLARKALETEESPEEKAKRIQAEELEDLKKWRKQQENDRKTAEQQEGYRQCLDIGARELEKAKEKFPTLYRLKDEGYLKQTVDRVVSHYAQTGEELDFYSVLEEAEEQLVAFVRKLSPQGVSERGNGAGQPAKPEAAEAPKVVSQRDAADRSAPRPMTRRERIDAAAKRLEQAH